MTGKELYEKYAGYKANDGIKKGIVCGYTLDDTLIIAITNGTKGWSKRETDNSKIIITHLYNSLLYWSVFEKYIIQSSAPKITLPSNNDEIEKLISSEYPSLSDEEKDIYINIFLAGYNSNIS
jgi:hypothetical protein